MPIMFQGATDDACCRPKQPALPCPSVVRVQGFGVFTDGTCAEPSPCDFECGTGPTMHRLAAGTEFVFVITLSGPADRCSAEVRQCSEAITCDTCTGGGPGPVITLPSTVVVVGNQLRVTFTPITIEGGLSGEFGIIVHCPGCDDFCCTGLVQFGN